MGKKTAVQILSCHRPIFEQLICHVFSLDSIDNGALKRIGISFLNDAVFCHTKKKLKLERHQIRNDESPKFIIWNSALHTEDIGLTLQCFSFSRTVVKPWYFTMSQHFDICHRLFCTSLFISIIDIEACAGPSLPPFVFRIQVFLQYDEKVVEIDRFIDVFERDYSKISPYFTTLNYKCIVQH